MNRIVLIGNGFDLAHGLKTSYRDFIIWYWEQRILGLKKASSQISDDGLCSYSIIWDNYTTIQSYIYQRGLTTETNWKRIDAQIKEDNRVIKHQKNVFFSNICKSIETKGWVDIENEYYQLLRDYIKNDKSKNDDSHQKIVELNNELSRIKDLLCEYLTTISIDSNIIDPSVQKIITSPFELNDITTLYEKDFVQFVQQRVYSREGEMEALLERYGWTEFPNLNNIRCVNFDKQDNPARLDDKINNGTITKEYRLPEQILLISFNYTKTAFYYGEKTKNVDVRYIHGELATPNSIIFGYGDEMDEEYKEILNKNDNLLLTHFKTSRYLETENYRKILQYAESAPFQIYIMGHSCGNSDRTLLNTLFEHKNCVSIKPFYHIDKDGKDNYMEIVQNIARNFTDMKLMRDRVVNKTYTEAFSDDRNN